MGAHKRSGVQQILWGLHMGAKARQYDIQWITVHFIGQLFHRGFAAGGVETLFGQDGAEDALMIPVGPLAFEFKITPGGIHGLLALHASGRWHHAIDVRGLLKQRADKTHIGHHEAIEEAVLNSIEDQPFLIAVEQGVGSAKVVFANVTIVDATISAIYAIVL